MSPTSSEWSALRVGKITDLLTQYPIKADCPAAADSELSGARLCQVGW